jgi:hypothetical protein
MCWQVRIQMAVRQFDHRVESEDRLGGREVELGQVEIRAPGVHAGIHVVSVRHSRSTEDFVVRRARLSLSSRPSRFSGSLSEIAVMTVG